MTKQEILDEARTMAREAHAGCDAVVVEAATISSVGYVFLRAVADGHIEDPRALAADLASWIDDRSGDIDLERLDAVMEHQKAFVADDDVKH